MYKLYENIKNFDTLDEKEQMHTTTRINELIKHAPINLSRGVLRAALITAIEKTYNF